MSHRIWLNASLPEITFNEIFFKSILYELMILEQANQGHGIGILGNIALKVSTSREWSCSFAPPLTCTFFRE